MVTHDPPTVHVKTLAGELVVDHSSAFWSHLKTTLFSICPKLDPGSVPRFVSINKLLIEHENAEFMRLTRCLAVPAGSRKRSEGFLALMF